MKHPTMEAARATAHETEHAARQTAERPTAVRIARVGFATKGAIYLLVGGLALKTAFGAGGETTDNSGALGALYQQPSGRFLVGALALGLFLYALWLFAQAALDLEGDGTEARGVAMRVGYAALGGYYTGLAVIAAQLVAQQRRDTPNSDASARDWTARLLTQPFGRALIVVAALAVFGVAGFFVYQAVSARFRERLDLSRPWAGRWAVTIGRVGFAALAVVDGLIALFLLLTAIRENPGEAKGIGGALAELAQKPYGGLLLGIVACGLIAYGVYTLVEASCRRLVTPGR